MIFFPRLSDIIFEYVNGLLTRMKLQMYEHVYRIHGDNTGSIARI
jgi:hypothetical protein